MGDAFDESGEDNEGTHMSSLLAMWREQLGDMGAGDESAADQADGQQATPKRSRVSVGEDASSSVAAAPASGDAASGERDVRWYKHAARYWEEQSADVEGMLGGFGELSEPDVKGSRDFLTPFLEGTVSGPQAGVPLATGRALDVGAGVGRVTKEFLVPFGFQEVDLLEQNPQFLELARVNLATAADGTEREHAGEFFASGMQDHEFGDRKYDCIWIQWCIIYLSDVDFIEFFRKCKNALSPGGLVVVKDNCTNKGFVLDREDSSITRSEPHLRWLFEQADLTVVRMRTQQGFPEKLFPVRMFALR
jgi:protein N-terminal methyltransferase